MNKINSSIFTSWPIIISLILLILNDVYLKYEFSNWFTGKISDFSGIFLIATILFSYYPKQKYIYILSIIIIFSFWKSPYSQYAINYFNSLGIIQYSRVVDYSDLIALIVLPLSLYIANHYKEYQLNFRVIKLTKIPIVILVVFAISGTSILVPHHKYEIRKNLSNEKIDIKSALEIVKEIANNYQLKCDRCDFNDKSGIYKNEIITLKYTVLPQQHGIIFDVKGVPSTPFSSSDSYKKMDYIKQALQSKLGKKFKNMVFVIHLPIINEYY